MEAELHMNQGHWDAAQQDLKQAEWIDPQSAVVHLGWARLWGHFNNEPEQQRAWLRAAELDEDCWQAWAGLGEMARKTGDLSRARDSLQRAIDLGADWTVWRDLVLLLDMMGMEAAAQEALELWTALPIRTRLEGVERMGLWRTRDVQQAEVVRKQLVRQYPLDGEFKVPEDRVEENDE